MKSDIDLLQLIPSVHIRCINFCDDLGTNSVDTFWGWDPKEVWALITWLFYAAVLHLRLSKGWHGEKSAWLAVLVLQSLCLTLL